MLIGDQLSVNNYKHARYRIYGFGFGLSMTFCAGTSYSFFQSATWLEEGRVFLSSQPFSLPLK